MKWTLTDRNPRPAPSLTGRYYNIIGPGGKMRTAYPVLGTDAEGNYVQFWDTNTGSAGIMYPRDVIAFSEPIELSEELVKILTPVCKQGFTGRNYCGL